MVQAQSTLEIDAPFVRSLHDRLARLFGGQVPAVELSSGERMVRAGHLFAQGAPFVRSVASALRERPDDYADIPIDPGLLDARQDRAHAFLLLHSALQMLADRCHDCYLMDQSDCITDAMAAVQQVRADNDRPFPPANAWQRETGMAVAEQILHERQEHKKRKARDNKKKKAQGGGKKRPRISPQEKAMKEYRRAEAEELLDSFIGAIGKAAPPAGGQAPPDPGPSGAPPAPPDGTGGPGAAAAREEDVAPPAPAAPAAKSGARPRGSRHRRDQSSAPSAAASAGSSGRGSMRNTSVRESPTDSASSGGDSPGPATGSASARGRAG